MSGELSQFLAHVKAKNPDASDEDLHNFGKEMVARGYFPTADPSKVPVNPVIEPGGGAEATALGMLDMAPLGIGSYLPRAEAYIQKKLGASGSDEDLRKAFAAANEKTMNDNPVATKAGQGAGLVGSAWLAPWSLSPAGLAASGGLADPTAGGWTKTNDPLDVKARLLNAGANLGTGALGEMVGPALYKGVTRGVLPVAGEMLSGIPASTARHYMENPELIKSMMTPAGGENATKALRGVLGRFAQAIGGATEQRNSSLLQKEAQPAERFYEGNFGDAAPQTSQAEDPFLRVSPPAAPQLQNSASGPAISLPRDVTNIIPEQPARSTAIVPRPQAEVPAMVPTFKGGEAPPNARMRENFNAEITDDPKLGYEAPQKESPTIEMHLQGEMPGVSATKPDVDTALRAQADIERIAKAGRSLKNFRGDDSQLARKVSHMGQDSLDEFVASLGAGGQESLDALLNKYSPGKPLSEEFSTAAKNIRALGAFGPEGVLPVGADISSVRPGMGNPGAAGAAGGRVARGLARLKPFTQWLERQGIEETMAAEKAMDTVLNGQSPWGVLGNAAGKRLK